MITKIYCVVWYPGISDEQHDESKELESLSEKWFKAKSYCSEVEEYYIHWEAPVTDLMPFYKARRPKYYVNRTIGYKTGLFRGFDPINIKHRLSVAFAIDYEDFVHQTSKIGRWNVIGKAVMAYLREMKYPVALRKVFDRERFNHDMEEFFHSIGCSLE